VRSALAFACAILGACSAHSAATTASSRPGVRIAADERGVEIFPTGCKFLMAPPVVTAVVPDWADRSVVVRRGAEFWRWNLSTGQLQRDSSSLVGSNVVSFASWHQTIGWITKEADGCMAHLGDRGVQADCEGGVAIASSALLFSRNGIVIEMSATGAETSFGKGSMPSISPDGNRVAFLDSKGRGITVSNRQDASQSESIDLKKLLGPYEGPARFSWNEDGSLTVSIERPRPLVLGQRDPSLPRGESTCRVTLSGVHTQLEMRAARPSVLFILSKPALPPCEPLAH
jgi:hypothetical protein